MNLYEYARSNALVHSDPMGTDAWVTGGTHGKLYVTLRDGNNQRIGLLAGEFYPSPGQFVWQVGRVEIGARLPQTGTIGHIAGDAEMDKRLQKWMMDRAEVSQALMDSWIRTYQNNGKSSVYTRISDWHYRGLTQNCNDWIDRGLDEFLGYNWHKEPFLTTGDDLVQQVNERFRSDGKPQPTVIDRIRSGLLWIMGY
jgi:hypothetical protein